ncbi:MAG: family 16 glycosylhydrolase [Bacteroidota bacterium]
MKKAASLFIFILLFSYANTAMAQRYELVWEERFDSLNRDVWTHWIGTAFNNEWQYYTDRDTNSYVEDGILYLIGLREEYEGRGWTSARVKSQYNADFLYGRFEIRAKLPGNRGMWPAIWMMPTDRQYGTWPYSGEMDIMEFRGHQTTKTDGTIHFSRRAFHSNGSQASADRRLMGGSYELPTGSFSEDFHRFGYEWTPDYMEWFVNDVSFLKITREEVEERAEIYPFNRNFYFILNLAIGGDYLGSFQPNELTPDRSEMLIDYIKVWQDQNQRPEIDLDYRTRVQVPGLEPFTLEADATDSDGSIARVDFFVQDKLVGTATEAPFEIEWMPFVDGCYNLEAKATDNESATRTSTRSIQLVVGTGCTQGPFLDEPTSLPGTLELEHFDVGGFEVSYLDFSDSLNTGNELGNDFRQNEAVDIIPHPTDSETNYVITDMEGKEWMEYTIQIEETGLYNIELIGISEGRSARINLELDGEELTFFTRITGEDGDMISRLREGIEMEAGTHTLRVLVGTGGIKLDKLIFSNSSVSNENSPLTPKQTQLFPNYPNPFNPTTNINFELGTAQNVTVAVYNTLGQPVSQLFSGRLNAGSHSYTFDASALSSGLYFVQLRTLSGIQTRKMTLLK